MVDISQMPQAFAQSLWAIAFSIWTEFAKVVPGIVGAIIIILIGWVLARIVKQIVIKILQSTRIDQWIDEQNLTAAIGGKEISGLVGSLTKWYIIGIFLAQAVSSPWLRLEIFSEYLKLIFVAGQGGSMPIFFALLGAIVVMVAGLLVARYFRNLIEATTYKIKSLFGAVVEAIVLIFAGVLALTFLVGPETTNIIVSLLKTFIDPFITAFAYMLAIVVGVSLLVNAKADLKKITDDLKKALK